MAIGWAGIKYKQGYRTGTCRNCKNRKLHEENKVLEHRCGIGGFVVKMTATCDKWEQKK